MLLFGTIVIFVASVIQERSQRTIREILDEKRVRHIDSFINEHPEALKITSGANKVIYKEKA